MQKFQLIPKAIPCMFFLFNQKIISIREPRSASTFSFNFHFLRWKFRLNFNEENLRLSNCFYSYYNLRSNACPWWFLMNMCFGWNFISQFFHGIQTKIKGDIDNQTTLATWWHLEIDSTRNGHEHKFFPFLSPFGEKIEQSK